MTWIHSHVVSFATRKSPRTGWITCYKEEVSFSSVFLFQRHSGNVRKIIKCTQYVAVEEDLSSNFSFWDHSSKHLFTLHWTYKHGGFTSCFTLTQLVKLIFIKFIKNHNDPRETLIPDDHPELLGGYTVSHQHITNTW